MPSPFYFSAINSSILNPDASLNILWNQQMAHNQFKSMVFMIPNFSAQIGMEFPMYGMWGNELLNPMLAIQQTMQSLQNGSWMNNINGMNLNNMFPNMSNLFPTTSQTTPGNSQATTSEEDQIKQAQYDRLKALLTKFKESNPDLDDEIKAKINTALGKSGKIGEKLDALKEACKSINRSDLKQALYEIDDIKANLVKSGFKFNKNVNSKIKSAISQIDIELSDGKCDTLNAFAPEVAKNGDVLDFISMWNDTHKNNNFIKFAASHIPSDNEAKMNLINSIKDLAKVLYDKSVNFVDDNEISGSNLKNANNELLDAIKACNDKASMEELAKKFDVVYAQIRILEAQKIANNIKKKYEFMNEFVTKDFITDRIVVKETEEDLKAEGIKLPTNADRIVTNNSSTTRVTDIDSKNSTAEGKLNDLRDENYVKESNFEGVFETNVSTSNAPAKFYMVRDDKLVELKNVKAITADGNCTLIDGTRKSLDEIETIKVTAVDVQTYKSTVERINKLISTDKSLEKCKDKDYRKGITLYKSKGKDSDGNLQYFVIRDNELQKINGKVLSNGYVEMSDGSQKLFNALADEDFCTIEDSEILITDEEQSTSGTGLVKKDKYNGETGDMDTLAETYNFAETEVSGYYKKNKEFYVYDTESEKMKRLEGVTRINPDGTMVKDGKIVAMRSIGVDATEEGKNLRKCLYAGTSNSEYNTGKQKLNSFSTYTKPEEIYQFLQSYEDERDVMSCWNTGICSQISSENGMNSTEKAKFIKMICKQLIKLMNNINYDRSSEDYKDIKYYANLNVNKLGPNDDAWAQRYSNWRALLGLVDSKRTRAANLIDDIIQKVLEKAAEKYKNEQTTEN